MVVSPDMNSWWLLKLIDINDGCPVKKVACKGAGAGILLDLPKMQLMTEEIVKQVDLPVTVKTRLGWDDSTIQIVEVAKLPHNVSMISETCTYVWNY